MDDNCSIFPSDVSPTGQGVDHRQVQRELGEVVVQLQEPVVLTASTVQLTWTVSIRVCESVCTLVIAVALCLCVCCVRVCVTVRTRTRKT